MDSNNGLLSINYRLLWGIVAHYFGLLGVPGKGSLSDSMLVWGVLQVQTCKDS